MRELSQIQKAFVASWLEQEIKKRKEEWEGLIKTVEIMPVNKERVNKVSFEYAAFVHVAKAFTEMNQKDNNVVILKAKRK